MVKYPLGIKNKKKTTIYKNRGMDLESLINKTNQYYLDNDIAVIYKKPTPIKIIKINNKENKITSAVFGCHSTTDYNGVYKGKYLDFEAKTTNSKTSFPIANFQVYQLEHFKKVIKQDGLAFVIFELKEFGEFYLLLFKDLLIYFANNKRDSIPISVIKEKGYKINLMLNPPLDYIKIIASLS